MFIDTHCHLTQRYANGDNLDTVLVRAKIADVDTVICATADPTDINETLQIVDSYENVFCTIGLHPDSADTVARQYLTDAILNHPRVLGIGEIGLDYHCGDENRKEQIKLFTEQLEIAHAYKLPVAIHTRDAEADTANILNCDICGVMHCFTSSWDLAKVMLDRGFYFSASGILTFKNAEDVRETFRKIPLSRIVIETDSPYCAPVPYRGKTCEPAFVVETARVLSDIKNININELAYILRQNTQNLYPKLGLE